MVRIGSTSLYIRKTARTPDECSHGSVAGGRVLVRNRPQLTREYIEALTASGTPKDAPINLLLRPPPVRDRCAVSSVIRTCRTMESKDETHWALITMSDMHYAQ